MVVFCVFLLFLRLILSFVSVVFDFSDSHNGVTPVSPILLPVDEKRNEKSELLMVVFRVSFVFTSYVEFSECCVWFQCFTQWCCSRVSNVVLCGCEVKEKKVICWWTSLVCRFCLYHPDRVQWMSCLISMIHSMMLPLCLQSCCLLMWREMKRVICWWMYFGCLLSFVFTTQKECSECCVWFQCFTQWCCSCVTDEVICWYIDNWRELLMGVFCVSFFCLHISGRVLWVLCLISILHSMTLFPCF